MLTSAHPPSHTRRPARGPSSTAEATLSRLDSLRQRHLLICPSFQPCSLQPLRHLPDLRLRSKARRRGETTVLREEARRRVAAERGKLGCRWSTDPTLGPDLHRSKPLAGYSRAQEVIRDYRTTHEQEFARPAQRVLDFPLEHRLGQPPLRLDVLEQERRHVLRRLVAPVHLVGVALELAVVLLFDRVDELDPVSEVEVHAGRSVRLRQGTDEEDDQRRLRLLDRAGISLSVVKHRERVRQERRRSLHEHGALGILHGLRDHSTEVQVSLGIIQVELNFDRREVRVSVAACLPEHKHTTAVDVAVAKLCRQVLNGARVLGDCPLNLRVGVGASTKRKNPDGHVERRDPQRSRKSASVVLVAELIDPSAHCAKVLEHVLDLGVSTVTQSTRERVRAPERLHQADAGGCKLLNGAGCSRSWHGPHG
ncbi:hypothetical protein DMC30DRAFT_405977 [Rhodotorula diobovata]|uniref:Uncharacterized protein n=1 Tax=Rhodotorula diobovata TaxID=5288 RepID=A0A5C5FN76_9BASI|nr:hypothetical protein DMC30DRAFT_405977 [Rhodotorula diobovata]